MKTILLAAALLATSADAAPVDLVAGDRLCLTGAGQTTEILLVYCPGQSNGRGAA